MLFLAVVSHLRSGAVDDLSSFLGQALPRLERALVARFGIDDGLDAVADTAAYAAEHWSRLQTMDNPVGYLYRVGQTRGSRLAGRWTRLEVLVGEPLTSDGPVDVDLQRALARLKPAERVAVVLVHSHGHSYAEAAEVLGVPTTTVTNLLHRGLQRLRQLLES
jgi:DNA-directed RNA polymerase specialized sigma24 family protein